jgi:hypothetical protein
MNVSNGLSPVTPDDHAGKLWIVTILSLIYALHVAGARAFIKRHMFGLDDVLYGMATVSSPLSALQPANSVAIALACCSINSDICWIGSWTWQEEFHHDTAAMGDKLTGKVHWTVL